MTTRQSRVARDARQVAVIPFCRKAGRLKLCLIRRKGTEAWGIPKGFIDPGDTAKEAALNEAFEEAGLDGQVVGGVLGAYEYTKGSNPLTVAVYLMEVHEEHRSWDEMSFRDRRWYSVDEAVVLLKKHPVRPLLDRVRSRLERSG